MEKFDFTFIKDTVLKENIEHVSDDIAELMMMAPSAKPQIQGCLRKTVIIYIASVIEALLLWKIKADLGVKEITMKDAWKYRAVKIIHTDDNFEVVGAKRSREKRNSNRLDFSRMITLCDNEGLLNDTLLKDLDRVRKMRNKLHIGGLPAVTKSYPWKDVEFAAKILKETTQSIR